MSPLEMEQYEIVSLEREKIVLTSYRVLNYEELKGLCLKETEHRAWRWELCENMYRSRVMMSYGL